jgi:hypothetical protein
MAWGFAVMFAALILGPTALAAAYIYWRRGRTLASILVGEHVVARWTYSPEEWRRYTEAERKRQGGWRLGLFLVIAFFIYLFSGIIWIGDHEHGPTVFLIMTGVAAVVGLAAFLSWAIPYRRNLRRVGEAVISARGLLLNGVFHEWMAKGASLDSVVWKKGKPPCLEFSYTYPGQRNRATSTVYVPVPEGREEEARRVVSYFMEE